MLTTAETTDPEGAVDTPEIVEPRTPVFVRTAGEVVRAAEAGVALLVTVLVAAVFQGGIRGAESDVVYLTTRVPAPVASVLIAFGQFVGVLGPIAVIVALLAVRKLRLVAEVVVAAVAGTLAMYGVSTLTSAAVELPGELGELRAIAYPGASFLAGASAVLVVLVPWIARPWQRLGVVLIALAAFTRIASGVDSPYDVGIAIVLGWFLGSVVLLTFGSRSRRPTGAQVADALAAAGIPVRRLEQMGEGARSTIAWRGAATDGRALFVKVAPGDRIEADRLVQLYRRIRYRDAAHERAFTTLRRSAEHEALLTYAACDGQVPCAPLLAVAEVEPDAMLLAFPEVPGPPLEGAGAAGITDGDLRELWQAVAQLRRRRIAHRDLRLAHVLRDGDRLVLVDFGFGEVAASDFQLRNDVAELLCATALEVGAERAVAAADAVLGADALGDALPRLQPLALQPTTRRAMAAEDGLLADLQGEVQKATGIDDVRYEELARVSPRTIFGLVVGALAFYALLPRLAEVSDIGATLAEARWQWIVPLLLAQGLTYLGAGISMVGSVPDRVPLLPTIRAQVAAAFVDVLAPASIGGMALNTRFLQKRGVDSGAAVAGVGLNAAAGAVAHVALLGIFFGLAVLTGANTVSVGAPDTATSSDDGASTTIILGVGVVVVAFLVFAVSPPGRRLIRHRAQPLIAEARRGIVDLSRRPRKIAALLGGSAIITLGFLGALIASVEAFGGGIPVLQLCVAYLIASAIGMVAPTPGGLGAVEAALIAALTQLGMSSDAAVSAVFLFRAGTFWLPVVPGWITFQLMQRSNEL